MWTHVTIDPIGPGGEPLQLEQLSVADYVDINVLYLEDGRFYVDATNDIDRDDFIGHADTLPEAKQMAERWALEQLAEMLKVLGAEGIWMVRGAHLPKLRWWTIADQYREIELEPGQPHGRIMLVRFPAGDGGEGGVEYHG